ncbi:MAG TPA: bifunctional oligoribonuclease/PAP phosphatase NrnA [Anaerolineae bacterium]|nr:bifunctional oligoribonuclease/PAP phosphatase NrnA [Anaerolineae bacterium]HIQ05343.1 bifunctional oligoribonuclease/PAP phosphatase NrnA [Anaerolineae bacterium]
MRTTENQVQELLDLVADTSRVLVLTHNDPDPDALASAFGLLHLFRLHRSRGQRIEVAYGGLLGRSENRVFARELHIRLRHIERLDAHQYDVIALVDTQPGAGNYTLPEEVEPQIVLDHHSRLRATSDAAFYDVRPSYGATTTIVVEYLRQAQVKWTPHLATALFYGIKTDTLGLARGASPADAEAYLFLHDQIDPVVLTCIEQAPLPIDYFRILSRALMHTTMYGHVVITELGTVHRPDIAAEVADFLLRMENVRWTICMGVYKRALVVSVRAAMREQHAGQLVRRAVGERGSAGGHGTMAGGRIPLARRDVNAEISRLRERFLTLLEVEKDGHSLLTERDITPT